MATNESDVQKVLALELGLQDGLSNAFIILEELGETISTRHVLAAISTLFTTVVAKALPESEWARTFAMLETAIPDMRNYRNDWLTKAKQNPEVPRPADPDAN